MTMKAILAVLAILLFGAAPSAVAQGWKYRSVPDKMSGEKIVTASVISSNSLRLDFPYRGTNHGQLTIRQHPEYGLDVIVSVARGQIICRGVDECSLRVKFGTSEPTEFEATGPADLSSDTLFIDDAINFISEAKKVRSILVQLNMFQAGNQVLEFRATAPLKWDLREAVAASTSQYPDRKTTCMTCHHNSERLVGPSLAEIRRKFAGDPEAAAQVEKAIVDGSTGQWGNVPMPQFPQMEAEETKSLVDWVLGTR